VAEQQLYWINGVTGGEAPATASNPVGNPSGPARLAIGPGAAGDRARLRLAIRSSPADDPLVVSG